MKITEIVLITIVVIGHLSEGFLCCLKDGKRPTNKKSGKTATDKKSDKTATNKKTPADIKTGPPVHIPDPIEVAHSILMKDFDTDYCTLEVSCGEFDKIKNIMCGAVAEFGPECLNATIVPFTEDFKNRFLHLHNLKRSFVAQGKLGTNELGAFFGTAMGMATMIWHDESRRLALQNAFQCLMKHDDCRRTKEFRYPGQNLAKFCNSVYWFDDRDVTEWAMNAWFEEYKDLPPKYVGAYGKGSAPRDQVGHFTQLIRDKAFAVGCAIIRSITIVNGKNMRCHYIACNYAVTNINGWPVYDIGPMGVNCKTGMNPKYPGLCSEHEDYYDDTILFKRRENTSS